jgi:NhaP-type Na+/H+ or K+/H+ antiporter
MFSNVIDLLFNCACFIYIGAIIPFDDFSDAELGVSCAEGHTGLREHSVDF